MMGKQQATSRTIGSMKMDHFRWNAKLDVPIVLLNTLTTHVAGAEQESGNGDVYVAVIQMIPVDYVWKVSDVVYVSAKIYDDPPDGADVLQMVSDIYAFPMESEISSVWVKNHNTDEMIVRVK